MYPTLWLAEPPIHSNGPFSSQSCITHSKIEADICFIQIIIRNFAPLFVISGKTCSLLYCVIINIFKFNQNENGLNQDC